ncbi:ATP-binding protein [Paractinoplanes atraurantiacus]|uniref:Sensor-like histidine kinase SenX3 n=1 Tax=Paractinoplanes atraurantiacus TaxID=1036182 RepID=A0A285F5G3_9ACTN|nr:ATP-binding protein [Actinoplanes atraurantiacus]SNY06560.1 His Kinase A (phospho-acceptor) domain-containing protein [Actinoplanes atraurantiacus]
MTAAVGVRRLGRRSGLVVGLVVLLGLLGSGLATYALHSTAKNRSERAFEQRQTVVAQVVMAELIQYGLALSDLSASLGAQAELTADSFGAIAAPINGQRLPGAAEVGYIVSATDGTAAAVQADWRRRGSAGLTLKTGGAGSGEHYFVVLGRSLTGSTATLGLDLRGTAQAVQALRSARTDGGISTSPTFEVPGFADRYFIMTAPVFATQPAAEAGRFRGWIAMTFSGKEFLGPTPGVIGGDQVSIEFADVSSGRPVTIATWKPGARVDDGMPARVVEIPIPQKQWQLTIRPTVRLLPAAEAWLARGAAAIGGVITLLLALLTATVVTSRDRALRRVDQATAELRDDIERREAVEQQLRRREEELVGFAGVVAHDLRSPLANVIGYADLMAGLDDGAMHEKQRRYLSRVQASAGRMRDLIDDLLAYAMADNTTLRTSEVDLNELVDSIVAERLGSAPAGTSIDCAPLPTACGDPSQLRQVLDNLIGNAIKYTPPDRTAEITVSATAQPDGLSRIEVADRGIGIPESQRSEVFNAFTRAEGSESYPGTGLGLAIVQRIIERHHGTVGVDDNPGGGTRFWFTVPTPAS